MSGILRPMLNGPPPRKGFAHERSADHGKEEWLTPPDLVQLLGPFDLDPCAPVRRPWDTAAKHYTVLDDGLLQPWHGRVWMNPPYGTETGKWLSKMARHGNGIALVLARTDTRAWHDHIFLKAWALLFIKGRLAFFNVDGTQARFCSGAPSVLVAYGQQNCLVLHQHRRMGAYCQLENQEERRGNLEQA